MWRKSKIQTSSGTAFQAGGTASVEALRRWRAAVKIKVANGLIADLEQRRWQEPGFASPVPCCVPSSALWHIHSCFRKALEGI